MAVFGMLFWVFSVLCWCCSGNAVDLATPLSEGANFITLQGEFLCDQASWDGTSAIQLPTNEAAKYAEATMKVAKDATGLCWTGTNGTYFTAKFGCLSDLASDYEDYPQNRVVWSLGPQETGCGEKSFSATLPNATAKQNIRYKVPVMDAYSVWTVYCNQKDTLAMLTIWRGGLECAPITPVTTTIVAAGDATDDGNGTSSGVTRQGSFWCMLVLGGVATAVLS